MFTFCASCGEPTENGDDLCRECDSRVANVETPYWQIAGMDPPGFYDSPPMKRYIVSVRVVKVYKSIIEASSPEDAIKAVGDGDGDYIDGVIDYLYALDPATWTVEEIDEENMS